MAKLLLLVGDSNVRRYFDRLSSAYCNEVDFVQARNLTEWSEAAPTCKKGYQMVTFSFLTNLIIESGGSGANDSDRLDAIGPALRTVISAIK